jgi:hypothetical protein
MAIGTSHFATSCCSRCSEYRPRARAETWATLVPNTWLKSKTSGSPSRSQRTHGQQGRRSATPASRRCSDRCFGERAPVRPGARTAPSAMGRTVVRTPYAFTMRRCSKCQRDLPSDAFAAKGTDRRGNPRRQPYCRECNRAYQRDHYVANKEIYKVKAAAWRRARRTELIENILSHLRSHPCVDCGEADPIVLHFDHVRGQKRDGVARLVRDQRPWCEVAAEIEKCDVRCANCHMRRTAVQLGWWRHLESAQWTRWKSRWPFKPRHLRVQIPSALRSVMRVRAPQARPTPALLPCGQAAHARVAQRKSVSFTPRRSGVRHPPWALPVIPRARRRWRVGLVCKPVLA